MKIKTTTHFLWSFVWLQQTYKKQEPPGTVHKQEPHSIPLLSPPLRRVAATVGRPYLELSLSCNLSSQLSPLSSQFSVLSWRRGCCFDLKIVMGTPLTVCVCCMCRMTCCQQTNKNPNIQLEIHKSLAPFPTKIKSRRENKNNKNWELRTEKTEKTEKTKRKWRATLHKQNSYEEFQFWGLHSKTHSINTHR